MKKSKFLVAGLIFVGLLLGVSRVGRVISAETLTPPPIPIYSWEEVHTQDLNDLSPSDQIVVSENEFHLLYTEEGDVIYEHSLNGTSSQTDMDLSREVEMIELPDGAIGFVDIERPQNQVARLNLTQQDNNGTWVKQQLTDIALAPCPVAWFDQVSVNETGIQFILRITDSGGCPSNRIAFVRYEFSSNQTETIIESYNDELVYIGYGINQLGDMFVIAGERDSSEQFSMTVSNIQLVSQMADSPMVEYTMVGNEYPMTGNPLISYDENGEVIIAYPTYYELDDNHIVEQVRLIEDEDGFYKEQPLHTIVGDQYEGISYRSGISIPYFDYEDGLYKYIYRLTRIDRESTSIRAYFGVSNLWNYASEQIYRDYSNPGGDSLALFLDVTEQGTDVLLSYFQVGDHDRYVVQKATFLEERESSFIMLPIVSGR